MKLRPYQHDLIAECRSSYAQGFRRPLVQAPTGCHAPGTEILMADGSIVRVEDLREGDQVMGPDGGPRNITCLHRGFDQMMKVTPTKGDPFTVNAGHLLTLVRNDGASKGQLVDVTVREWMQSNAYFKHTAKLVRSGVEFEEADQPIDPYLLGVILGDGCISDRTIIIFNPDDEIAAEVSRIGDVMGYKTRQAENAERCRSLHLLSMSSKNFSHPVREPLRAMGLLGSNSGSKFIPRNYQVASRHQRLEILAGLIDTDGHQSGGYFDIVTKSPALAHGILFIARSLGLAAYAVGVEKSCQNFTGHYARISISGNVDMIPCRVERKQAPPRKMNKSVLRTGFTVEPAGVGEYFGFECDGDHRYLMGDFTITHNSGKTVLMCEITRSAIEKGNNVLVLAPRRELIHQTSAKLASMQVVHGIIMAGEPPSMMQPVQVACVPTLHRRAIKAERIGMPRADVVIIDEAHLAVARTTSELLSHYPSAAIFGFTATPARSDGKALGLVFDKLILGPSVRRLTDEGYLSPARYFTGSTPDLRGLRTQAGDYHQGELGERVSDVRLVGDIVTNWSRLASDRQTVVFATNIAHSMSICEQFRAVGVSAEHLDGNTPPDERAAILRRIESGDTRVLCSCQVLEYGWDSPSVSCAILARPTKSIVRYLQMVGRVLRVGPGHSDCLVLDHAGVVEKLGFVDDEFPWSLDGKTTVQERKASERKAPEPMTCKACGYTFLPDPICPECGTEQGGRYAKAIETTDADLTELQRGKKKANREWTADEKIAFYGELKQLGVDRGYKPGWADAKYRERLSVWPNAYKHAPLKQPTRETLAWVQHTQIKWARSKVAA